MGFVNKIKTDDHTGRCETIHSRLFEGTTAPLFSAPRGVCSSTIVAPLADIKPRATDLFRAVDELLELIIDKCSNNTKITVEHLAAALASLDLDVALEATSLWRPSYVN